MGPKALRPNHSGPKRELDPRRFEPVPRYARPQLLQQLLEPVLAYAHNETVIKFSDPYSPHQLGTYP